MKVVVDTNVVISGAMGKGETVNKLFDVLFVRHQLFSSDELIKEAKEKLESVRLKKFIDPIYKKGFVDKFLLHATILKPEIEVRVCRDADDDKVLSLALAANADYIISGDQDLLVLHPFRNISIVSPSAFLDEAKM